MPTLSTGNTSIPYNASLRIGYRNAGSSAGFTYIPTTPTSDQLPFEFVIPTIGAYEIEYTVLCTSCNGNLISEPVVCEIVLI